MLGCQPCLCKEKKMAEKRKFESVICVKIGAKTAFKIELFPAEQWQESAQGRYRLRINRCWHDLPGGGPCYLDMMQVLGMLGELLQGRPLELPARPHLPCKSRVSVPNGRFLDGQPLYDSSWTYTEPILDYSGQWVVAVFIYGQGTVVMPVDSLIVREFAPHRACGDEEE